MIRTQAWLDARPWRKEGLTPSQGLKKYRAAHMSTIMALTDPRVRHLSAEAIVGHVRQFAFVGPGWVHAHALRQSAGHHERTYGHESYVDRLQAAAHIFWDGGEGIRPPTTLAKGAEIVPAGGEVGAEGVAPSPARTTRTRQALQALLPPQPTYTPLNEHEIIHGLGTVPGATEGGPGG